MGLDDFRGQLEEDLIDLADALLEDAASDLATYIPQISGAIVAASTIGDLTRREARVEELVGQIGMVAEIQRIRATNEAFDMFETVVQAIAKTAANALVVAL